MQAVLFVQPHPTGICRRVPQNQNFHLHTSLMASGSPPACSAFCDQKNDKYHLDFPLLQLSFEIPEVFDICGVPSCWFQCPSPWWRLASHLQKPTQSCSDLLCLYSREQHTLLLSLCLLLNSLSILLNSELPRIACLPRGFQDPSWASLWYDRSSCPLSPAVLHSRSLPRCVVVGIAQYRIKGYRRREREGERERDLN